MRNALAVSLGSRPKRLYQLLRRRHATLTELPPHQFVPYLSESLLIFSGARYRSFLSSQSKKTSIFIARCTLILDLLVAVVFQIGWIVNTGDQAALSAWADCFSWAEDKDTHLLLVGSYLCISLAVGAAHAYNWLLGARQDSYFRMIRYLFTRDSSLLIIPMKHRQQVKIWKLALLAFLSFQYLLIASLFSLYFSHL